MVPGTCMHVNNIEYTGIERRRALSTPDIKENLSERKKMKIFGYSSKYKSQPGGRERNMLQTEKKHVPINIHKTN